MTEQPLSNQDIIEEIQLYSPLSVAYHSGFLRWTYSYFNASDIFTVTV